jgi:hypothetical protein
MFYFQNFAKKHKEMGSCKTRFCASKASEKEALETLKIEWLHSAKNADMKDQAVNEAK